MYEKTLRTLVDVPVEARVQYASAELRAYDATRDHAYLCGECGIILARVTGPKDLENIVLQCGNCGAYNVVD